MGMAYGMEFQIIPWIIRLGGLLVVGVLVFNILAGLVRWCKNNASPILTMEAQVVAKREWCSHNRQTRYFATFEVENGKRMELALSGREYGLLTQGDMGTLTVQGTRYKGFERR